MGIDPSFSPHPGNACSNSRHCLTDPYEGSIIIICTSRQHGKSVLNILDKKKANEADIFFLSCLKKLESYLPPKSKICVNWPFLITVLSMAYFMINHSFYFQRVTH